MGRDTFFITTPIYYANDVPHIGHAYTEVASDFVARYRRLRGDDVFYLTGTDEHGLKVARAAEENGVTPKAWTDSLEPRWREVWERLDISYDDYIRTTEPRHYAAVAKILQAVHENGRDDIYEGTYEGLYCVACEAYYTEDDLIEGNCPIHGRPVEQMREQNYFFRLSAYRDRLLEHYAAHPDAIEPEVRRNEVLSLIEGGLHDFSISRTTFDWGVPLPWDPEHVTYVWFDALTNYITAAGYADDPDRFERLWPARMHMMGKDIVRFHAVYWPAMLMAAGLEPAAQVWAHGYLLVGGEKMSKTKLTGIHPFELLDHFGVDSYRYYFMREISFGQDGSFSWESMTERHNADLANGLGNLASRVLAMLAELVRRRGARARHARRRERPALGDRRGPRSLRRTHARRAIAARPRGGLGHRGQGEPLPRREGAVEAREGPRQPRRGRERALRRRRDPARARDRHRPDHARGRGEALAAARHRRAARRPAIADRRGLGWARARHPHDEGRVALPSSRGRLSDSLRRCEPLHFGVRLPGFMFHVKLPPSTACGDPCRLRARDRPEPSTPG